MNALQEIFDAKIDEFINRQVTKIVKEKFLEQGIILTDSKIQKIVKKINEDKESEITFDIEDNDILSPDKKTLSLETINQIELVISDDESYKILNTAKSVIAKIYPETVKETSKVLFEELKKRAFENVKEVRADRAQFQFQLEKLWRKPFLLFELYLGLTVEAVTEINKEYGKVRATSPDIVLDVLIRLHARASQIGLEILTLIESGLADGAHARWRTLHEVAVVSRFIEKHGKDVAERYDAHNSVESYKAALQHQQYAKSLKQKEIPKREMNQIKREYDDALNKFGTDFKESYGWASKALNKQRPNFADIEKDVGLDKWRPYYKMASHNVHANPKGISFKLGLLNKTRSTILLAGASDYGFTDPAHGAAISLLQATSTLLFNKSNIDKIVLADVLKKFEELIGEEFLKTQKKFETKYSK